MIDGAVIPQRYHRRERNNRPVSRIRVARVQDRRGKQGAFSAKAHSFEMSFSSEVHWCEREQEGPVLFHANRACVESSCAVTHDAAAS